MATTHQGAKAHEHAMNHSLEFFSKAGSLYTKRSKKNKSFYSDESTAKDLFVNSWITDKPLSMKLLLWLRDCRGGAGNRSGSAECYKWLAEYDPQWILANMHWMPQVGRWSDVRSLFGTQLEKAAAHFWGDKIKERDVLASKWAKRTDHPIRKVLGMRVADFRRLLANIRKDHIVEYQMCSGEWGQINYEHVPSVAMARYTKAFGKHDEARFNIFKEKLVSGEATIKADVLFPHDCIRTALNGDWKIADAQFDALPNFLVNANDKQENVMVLSDTSGSMDTVVGGSVRAVDISQGLALYCSSRVPENSPFYKRFVGFGSEGKFKDWRGMKFHEAVRNRKVFDRAVAGTRIDKALDLILKIATTREISQELMPTTLLIVSDMQFANGAADHQWSNMGLGYGAKEGDIVNVVATEVEKSLRKWDAAGYDSPKIVYWNTAGYAGQQATVDSSNIGMVSGFSPSILKAIFAGDDFTPTAIMLNALVKYSEIVIPE